jgi:hypothetical protein
VCNHDIDHAGKVHTRWILFDTAQELPKNCVTPESGFDIQRTVHRDILLEYKPTGCTISQIYFDKELYMFQTDLLSIIKSLNTVYTAIGICHASYVGCLLTRSGPC